jgi:hypothetical protein
VLFLLMPKRRGVGRGEEWRGEERGVEWGEERRGVGIGETDEKRRSK